MHLYEKRPGLRLKGLIVTVLVFVAAIILFTGVLSQTEQTASREQTILLETAIRNAAVSCYATEGKYPATLDEIVRDYGIVVDRERFYVIYDVFASNIMPEINVLVRGES